MSGFIAAKTPKKETIMKPEVIINKNGKAKLKGFTKANFKYFNTKKLQQDILFNLVSADKAKGEKKEYLQNLERILEKIKLEIESYISINEKFKNIWFWEISSKRKDELTGTYIDTTIKNKYIQIELYYRLRITWRYNYVYKSVVINGEEKNLRSAKQILKEVELLEKFLEEYKKSRFYGNK